MKFIIDLIFQLCLIPFRCLHWFIFAPKPKRRYAYTKQSRPIKYKPHKQPKIKTVQLRQFYTKKDGSIIKDRYGRPKYKRNKIKF
jgi:hypothetical protein